MCSLQYDLSDTSVTTVGTEGNQYQARLKSVDPDTKTAIEEQLGATFGGVETLQYRNVGPAVGREVTRSALIAVLFVSIAIVLFMFVAFRNVSHPVRYGLTAVVAMFHDIIVACGFAALMGVVAGWEVDALFLTALLTVLGFSVQDTIVVFDRVRENSARHRGEDFETICQPQLAGDSRPVADHSVERDVHHGRDPDVRRLDHQAVHRRSAGRHDQRHLLIDLQRNAAVGDLGQFVPRSVPGHGARP